MMQFPAVTPVTVLPLTVQTPVVWEVKATGLPEAPPAALTVPVPPTTTEGAVPKVIVWRAQADREVLGDLGGWVIVAVP